MDRVRAPKIINRAGGVVHCSAEGKLLQTKRNRSHGRKVISLYSTKNEMQ